MTNIPQGTKFIGIGASVPTPENRSSQNNAFQEVYTIQDIVLSQKTYRSISSIYTIISSDYMIECISGSFSVSLPTAIGITGKEFVIKNSGTGTITVDPNGTETIDGETDWQLFKGDTMPVMSNGTNWIISK
jgi:hypothetical protein